MRRALFPGGIHLASKRTVREARPLGTSIAEDPGAAQRRRCPGALPLHPKFKRQENAADDQQCEAQQPCPVAARNILERTERRWKEEAS